MQRLPYFHNGLLRLRITTPCNNSLLIGAFKPPQSLKLGSTSARRTFSIQNAFTHRLIPSLSLNSQAYGQSSSTQSWLNDSLVFNRMFRNKNTTHSSGRRGTDSSSSSRSHSSPKNDSRTPPPSPRFNSLVKSESRFKRWFDRIPSDFIVYGILALNGVVYLAWQHAGFLYKNGDPRLLAAMYDNVTMSWSNIANGRFWTLFTAMFSQSAVDHWLMNAMSFYFLAPPMIQFLGNTAFLGLYAAGGVACCVASLLLNRSVRDRQGYSHGASGAIYAVTSFFACVSPRTTFLLFFVIPAPAWLLVSGIFVYDGISTILDRQRRTDGAGHVGGIIAGVLYFLLKVRTRLP